MDRDKLSAEALGGSLMQNICEVIYEGARSQINLLRYGAKTPIEAHLGRHILNMKSLSLEIWNISIGGDNTMEGKLEKTFFNLCQQAYDLDFKVDNVLEVEPILISLIMLVKDNPEYRSIFVRLFKFVTEGDYHVPIYLIPFCMRELRFPEIRDAIILEMEGDRDTARFRRRIGFMKDVLHAFDDEIWEEAVLWPYYAHELN